MQQIIYPAAAVGSCQHTKGHLPSCVNFDIAISTFSCVAGRQRLLQQLPYRQLATSQEILDRKPPSAFQLHRGHLQGTFASGDFEATAAGIQHYPRSSRTATYAGVEYL